MTEQRPFVALQQRPGLTANRVTMIAAVTNLK
jgi:hypothetical protein